MWTPLPDEQRQPPAVSRRRFLRTSGGVLASLSLLAGCDDGAPGESVGREAPGEVAATSGTRGFILGPGRDRNDKTGEYRYHLSFVDLDADSPQVMRAPLEFFGHGLVPHPVQRNRLAVFEKRGAGACEFDLATGLVLRNITTVPSRQFYGHGAFTADGRLCFATESDLDDGYRGVVAVRDSSSMKLIGEFPSFGTAPHDCLLVDGGKTMVITNGGDRRGGESAPSVTFIDVASRNLVDRLEFDSPDINAGHVAVASNGDVAVVSAPREGEDGLGAITLRPHDHTAVTMTEPAAITSRMKLETLSVAIHEPSGIVGATTPEGDLVTFWNLRTRRYVGKFEVRFPRGIVLSEAGDEFIVSHGKTDPALTMLSAKTLEPPPGAQPLPCHISGSHLINYRHDA